MPERILIIDDEPDVVAYLAAVLEDEGFAVACAGSGEAGLEQARADKPDLITLDVTMPGMSGVEVLTELRRDSALAAVPVIIITGVARFANLTEYRGVRPPEGFLRKPVDLGALTALVSELLA